MSHQLLIEPIGITIKVEEEQTILDAALRQGIYIPHACGHGLCGTCKIQVLEGNIEIGDASPFALMDFEREEGRALACCATLRTDTTIEADIDEDEDAEIIPVQDFVGDVVIEKSLTPTIKMIRLRLNRAMHFQAGQYVQLAIPGLLQTRAFSIANSPSDVKATGEIELNIRLVPGGQATSWLHGKLKIGDSLRCSGPYGRFFVRHSAARPMIFMAGGSGLSSPRSMILDLLERGIGLPITLVYGQRSKDELYYDNEFRTLCTRYPNFTYVPALSQDSSEMEQDVVRGFVHEAAKSHFGNDFSGHQAYLCGPPAMIESCLSTLMQGRLFERDIYHEVFISAADAQRARSPVFRKI